MEFQIGPQVYDCGRFRFTPANSFSSRQTIQNEPKRCKACKGKRAAQVGAGGTALQQGGDQDGCSACGKRPPSRLSQPGTPVFCRECFSRSALGGFSLELLSQQKLTRPEPGFVFSCLVSSADLADRTVRLGVSRGMPRRRAPVWFFLCFESHA